MGKRLQQARQAAGLTQQELCHRANLSYSTLAKIERGAIKTPSIFTIISIAAALGSSLDTLLGFEIQAIERKKTSKSGVKFVYFDVNGCLIGSYQRAFTDLAAEHNIAPDVVESAFWHYNNDACEGRITMAEFNAALAERCGVAKVDWAKHYLSAVESIKPLQDLLPWAAENYKVGLLTNVMPGLLDAMFDRGILPNLTYDAIIDSSVVKAIKPEHKIYEIAKDRANAAPHEILLIDDTRNNLVAAEKLGWHVLWFDNNHADESAANIKKSLEPTVANPSQILERHN